MADGTKITNPQWVQKYLFKDDARIVTSVSIESMSEAGGLSADVNRLRITLDNDDQKTLVLKRTKPSKVAQSQALGKAREACLYMNHRKLNVPSSILAKTHYVEVDMKQGTELIVLEDLSDCVQMGHFFGNGSPANWGKDLESLTSGEGFKILKNDVCTIELVTDLAFEVAASLHSILISDATLRDEDMALWLRGSNWRRGEGREDWEGYQAFAANCWAKTKMTISDNKDSTHTIDGVTSMKPKCSDTTMVCVWSALVVDCIDAAITKASPFSRGWESFQLQIAQWPLTLVHGDFHPANMLIRPLNTENGEKKNKVVLLDWEIVGIGSGPQDLGQYMISHTPPTVRRKIERRCVEKYFLQLSSNGQNQMTIDQCWGEYIEGGVGRWLWMLPILSNVCPPIATQYFHDQVLDFLETHGISAENTPMPRA